MTVRERGQTQKAEARIQVLDIDGRRTLRVSTREPAIFLLISGGFAVLSGYAALNPWSVKLSFPPYRFILASVALGLAYFILKNFVNATRFFVSGGALHAEHGPLPPTRRSAVPLRDLTELGYAPLRGIFARYSDGNERKICGYEDGGRELPQRLVGELGIEAAVVIEE